MADPTMNRQSGGLDLTPETQAQIWQTATYQSAFMQLHQYHSAIRQRVALFRYRAAALYREAIVCGGGVAFCATAPWYGP